MIYIRADANEIIGTGHIMRCLSIAGELQKQGESVTFLVADERCKKLVKDMHFKVICLDSVWNHLEQEIKQLVRIIKENRVSMLLIDSYYVSDLYLRTVGMYTKTAYIDDLNAFVYPVDLLINYNIYADAADYVDRYQRAGLNTKFAIGTEYVPLRDEFIGLQREVRQSVSKILITSGGADTYNVVGNILSAIEQRSWFGQMEYEIILGRFNTYTNILKKQWGHYKNIHLLQNVSRMSDYMKLCDVAVTAGGVTTYELCASGIPSVMYTLADNQYQIAKTISKRKVIPWVGDVREEMIDCMKKIAGQLEEYMSSTTLRKENSQKMQKLVDGYGCKRLARRILE